MNRNLKSLTQKDVQISCRAALHQVGNKLIKNDLNIEDIGDYLPGCVMIQDFGKMVNIYMNKTGCEILHADREELMNMGPAYFDTFFPKEEIQVLKPELIRFANNNDPSALYSFFQQARPLGSNKFAWYFTTSRIYPVGALPGNMQLMHIAIGAGIIGCSAKKISRLIDDNSFASKNFTKFCSLSKREKEIISLVAAGNSSCNISDMLFISYHTVNNHRKNIQSKLSFKSFSELIRFAIAFDLI
jgi:LuxR family transcriptional regulator